MQRPAVKQRFQMLYESNLESVDLYIVAVLMCDN